MNLFRIHIRPRGGKAISRLSFDYCLEHEVIGMGWDVGIAERLSWEAYLKKATAKFGSTELSRVKYLKNQVRTGDLLWSRYPQGSYYLAQATGTWMYHADKNSLDADIVNVCPCKWFPVPEDDMVPGKIVACFRARRTIQRIKDETSIAYSQLLWNRLSSRQDFVVDGAIHDLYSCLGSEDCEDVMAIYLQTQGWLIIPNSRKADTMSYEYRLIHSKTYEKAVVQVKTGGERICRDEWKGRKEKVFLFQSQGLYDGAETCGVECLSPTQMEIFMRNNRVLMPSHIRRWLDYTKGS